MSRFDFTITKAKLQYGLLMIFGTLVLALIGLVAGAMLYKFVTWLF